MVSTLKWCIAYLLANGVSLVLPTAHAFVPLVVNNNNNNAVGLSNFSLAAKKRSYNSKGIGKNDNNNNSDNETSFLLQEFKTHTGEIIDPYRILKVSRTADRLAIKRSYRDLSRRYHPDGVRHKDILPGSCNNLDEVREHWERIKLSYEILSDRKRRTRYDRHTAIADPGAALQRAAVNAAWNGAVEVGKGLFSVGAFAVKQVAGMATKQKNGQTQQPNEASSSSSSSSSSVTSAGTARAVPEAETN